MANKWLNEDGLLIKYGQSEGDAGVAGEYVTTGPTRVLEFKIGSFAALNDDPTTLVDGVAQGILDLHTTIPEGVVIEKVELIATVAATSAGSARLDVGVVDNDFASNDDDDALIVAELYDSLPAIGTTIVYTQGSTRHGDLVGTLTTKELYVTASYDTAAFATGGARLRIHLAEPI